MLIFIILLSLRVLNNKLYLNELIPYSRMGKKEVINLARECGCSVKKDKEEYIIKLHRLKLD